MKKWVLIILCIAPAFLFAQTGNFFLSHFTSGNIPAGNICFDIEQDAKGIMYFATDAGVLQFDGRNWDILKGGSAVYSLQISHDGTIYWCGAKGYGKIEVDTDGFQHLKTLSDSTAFNIFQSLILNETIFFVSNEAVYILDGANTTSTIQSNASTGSFTGLFELFGAVYVNTAKEGLFKIHQQKLVQSKLPIHDNIIFSDRIDNNYILATADNKLYRCNETLTIKPINVEDQNYINSSVIVGGSWVNKHLLALATLRGGVIFINPITGRTIEIINYATGLPDNEVFALSADHHKNIWVAHEYGFTRISPFMPMRSFSHYPGLRGNLLCTYTSANSLYVGTSLGLFKLKKEDVYEELTYYVDVVPKEVKKSNEKIETNTIQQEESQKRGFLNFLRRNRRKEKEVKEANDIAATTTPNPDKKTKPTYKRVKRSEKLLRSSHYVYKKVDGINAKVTNILEVDGKIIASGLGGVYEIDDLKAKPILEEPVRFSFASQYKNILLTSTYDNEVKSLVAGSKGWQNINLLNAPDDQINFIFEGKENELWFCGLDKIYNLEITDQEIRLNKTINLPGANGEPTVGISWDNLILFVNAEGFFTFNRHTHTISKIDTLPSPKQYVAYSANILYRDQHGWKLTGKESGKGKLQLLNLFQDFRFITTDKKANDLWMISRNNELYKLFAENISSSEEAFPVFVKSITSNNRKTKAITNINLSEDHSAISFDIIQPDYVGPEAIEFRYMLKGMDNRWSEWSSNNNKVDFPYLPPGEYTLLVQSRNIFGETSDLKPLFFQVLPPYWKRPWFYAMEFAILASLVLLSFQLNNRYRIISRILSLLTIILLIEFIQTVIDSTLKFDAENPVVDFIIQVFIALMILPVEGYLRKLMFRSMDPSSKLYQFLTAKRAQTTAVSEEAEEYEATSRD